MIGLTLFLLNVFQFLCLNASPTITGTAEPRDYYTVAVFEHNRKGNGTTQTASHILNWNLDYYERATNLAGSQGADIIIFPEYGLMPFLSRQEMKNYLEEVPDPRQESSNPCNEELEFSNRPIMYRLSCMAKQNNIVIVANTGDIQSCTKEENPNCPDDGTFHFNANVVFDRDGTILAKSYKEHLFFEIGMDLPQEPQNPIFTTDFGTFAMFICFDISWKPAAVAARRSDIDAIIMTPMWGDLKPLWTSVQYWDAFARGNNVTHLVPNVNIPGYSSVGSGVFAGRMGALKYTYNPDGLSKLVISRAPKSRQPDLPFSNPYATITVVAEDFYGYYDEDQDGKDIPTYCTDKRIEDRDLIKDYGCHSEDMTNYTLVKLTEPNDKFEICNNGMCCRLEYSAEDMQETYYLGVNNGSYKLFHYSYCQENCLVLRCDDFNGTRCSKVPSRSNTIFHKLELRANFSTKFVYPSVLKSGHRLAPSNEWTHGMDDDDALIGYLKYESSSSQPLLVAGLNGRCYDRDPPYSRW